MIVAAKCSTDECFPGQPGVACIKCGQLCAETTSEWKTKSFSPDQCTQSRFVKVTMNFWKSVH